MPAQLQEISDLLEKMLQSAGLSSPEFIVLVIVLAACTCLPWMRIFSRAGYNPALGLLMFIPIVNFFLFLLFAFHKWPIEADLRTPDSSSYYR